jgi:16S rRNA (guanine527-N7)-methyltransferase
MGGATVRREGATVARSMCWYAPHVDTFERQIADGMRQLGVDAAPGVVDALARHARRVLEANKAMNLTSIAEADFVALHVLDSLSAHAFLRAGDGGRFADLGSGAGYPGVPLAVVTGRPVALVESVCKKAAFLEGVCADLRLEATVHPIRAEELALTHAGAFGSVVARALSSLPSLVELAAPLLMAGGELVCLKGRPGADELQRGDSAAAKCGLTRERTEAMTVPGVDAVRTIVVYRKTGPPRLTLPRRTGLAQRQPLA